MKIWLETIGSTLWNAHFLRFWAEIRGWYGAMRPISQMGGPDPKTYPSKPSETHITFLKYALSRRRICELQSALQHCFWPKNALFCTRTASGGCKNGVFCTRTNSNVPLDMIPIHFRPVYCNFFLRSLKSFFLPKTPPMKSLIRLTALFFSVLK